MTKAYEILKAIPDFYNEKKTLKWIENGRRLVGRYPPETLSHHHILSLEWSDLDQKQESLLGHHANENWRKFVLATFLADLICYTQPADQVNFDRLLFVMHAFPQGFRMWWIEIENAWWPVGYTGWYPIPEITFEVFEKSPEKLKNRMVVPQPSSKFLYLFNFSAAKNLKKTPLSKQLLKTFIQDIVAQQAQGLACITVSEDGVRVAHSLGMTCSGQLTVDGIPEGMYTKRSL